MDEWTSGVWTFVLTDQVKIANLAALLSLHENSEEICKNTLLPSKEDSFHACMNCIF